MSRQETDDALAVLEENGIEVTEPTPELAELLQQVGETMTEEWVGRAGEQGQTILDAYESARD
jgi:TRAP-type C4-dicarboxylate transport system substrate-binding protein